MVYFLYMKYYIQMFGTVMIVFLPFHIVLAQNTTWLQGLINGTRDILPGMVAVLVSVAVLVFVYGLMRFIANAGDEKVVTEGKKFMVWGVVALFVIIGTWGFVEILINMFDLTTNATPPPQIEHSAL